MGVLGGMGSLFGPLIGAVALLLLVVLFARGSIDGLIARGADE
jgi:ABC-type branched-subunit amino acid transport system permease subunit